MPKDKNNINSNNTNDKIINQSPLINNKTVSLTTHTPIILKRKLKTEIKKTKIKQISNIIPQKKNKNKTNK